MGRLTQVSILAAGGALAVAAAAHGGPDGTAAAPKRVTIAMSEFRFALQPKTVPRGEVVFAVANRGSIRHDFKIAGRKTPVLAPGTSRTLRVRFAKPGRYAFVCTLPSHAAAGMKGVLVVK